MTETGCFSIEAYKDKRKHNERGFIEADTTCTRGHRQWTDCLTKGVGHVSIRRMGGWTKGLWWDILKLLGSLVGIRRCRRMIIGGPQMRQIRLAGIRAGVGDRLVAQLGLENPTKEPLDQVADGR